MEEVWVAFGSMVKEKKKVNVDMWIIN
jgi:hypothetical protein